MWGHHWCISPLLREKIEDASQRRLHTFPNKRTSKKREVLGMLEFYSVAFYANNLTISSENLHQVTKLVNDNMDIAGNQKYGNAASNGTMLM